MFSSSHKGIESYNKIKLGNTIDSASPHKLILMLFDGALLSLASAAQFIREGKVAEKGKAISDAISIVSSGLQASLNMEAGGELAERLNALYDYMCQRLLHANLKNDVAALDEVSRLLNELRGAWQEIEKDSAAISGNGDAA